MVLPMPPPTPPVTSLANCRAQSCPPAFKSRYSSTYDIDVAGGTLPTSTSTSRTSFSCSSTISSPRDILLTNCRNCDSLNLGSVSADSVSARRRVCSMALSELMAGSLSMPARVCPCCCSNSSAHDTCLPPAASSPANSSAQPNWAALAVPAALETPTAWSIATVVLFHTPSHRCCPLPLSPRGRLCASMCNDRRSPGMERALRVRGRANGLWGERVG